MNYVFMTDASCDLTQELVNEIGVEVLPMEFHMEDKSYLHYPDCRMMSLSEFYSKLKDGIDSKTTQINYDSFYKSFENYLKAYRRYHLHRHFNRFERNIQHLYDGC